jgi:hypothetical protein
MWRVLSMPLVFELQGATFRWAMAERSLLSLSLVGSLRVTDRVAPVPPPMQLTESSLFPAQRV